MYWNENLMKLAFVIDGLMDRLDEFDELMIECMSDVSIEPSARRALEAIFMEFPATDILEEVSTIARDAKRNYDEEE